MIKYKPTEPLLLNYDNIFMMPITEDGTIQFDETLPRLSKKRHNESIRGEF